MSEPTGSRTVSNPAERATGGWITSCPHCPWSTFHPTLRTADRALHQHTRDKHPQEPR